MAITPTGRPFWTGENDHTVYGGSTEKKNWRDQPATNHRTDISAEQFARLTENAAHCARVADFAVLLVNTDNSPHTVDWLRIAACRVSYRESRLIIDGEPLIVGGVAQLPAPPAARNYLLRIDHPYDGFNPPDQDPVVVSEPNGLPQLTSVTGGFNVKFALHYRDPYGVIARTKILQAFAFSQQSTASHLVRTQLLDDRTVAVRVADSAGNPVSGGKYAVTVKATKHPDE